MSRSKSFIPKAFKAVESFAVAFCLAWQPTNMAWAAGESIVETIRALIEKGNSLLSHGSYEAAIAEYEKVLEKEPNNPYAKSNIVLAHNNWGITYFKQGKLEQAKKEWDTALKLDPNDKNAHNNIAVLKRELAKQGKTLDDIDTEKKAEAAKKEKDKAAAEAAPSSAVVILSAPQKQPASESSPEASAGASGAQIMTPQRSSGSGAQIMTPAPSNNSSNSATSSASNSGSGGMILSGGTSSGPSNAALGAPEKSASNVSGAAKADSRAEKGSIQTYGQQGYSQDVPAQAEASPAVPKTKAQEELEAFKRLTSTGDKASAQEPTASADSLRRYVPTSGAPLVFHSSARLKTDSGESADFMDDKLGSTGNAPSNSQVNYQTAPQANSPANYQVGSQARVQTRSQASPQSNYQSNYQQNYTRPQANPPYQFMRPPDQQQNSAGTTDSAQTSSDSEKPKSRKHHNKKQVAEAPAPSSDSSVNSPNSIDGVLNRLEVKIYGQSTTESSIIKRLEQMETDSFGRPSVGAISARLTRLKKMYNVSD